MVVDEHRGSVPGRARVLEIADHLLLLGVDAHDRQVTLGETRPLFRDVDELLVPIRVRAPGDALAVDAQREGEVVEDPGHCPRADHDAEGTQFLRDLPSRASRPLEARARVTGDVVFQQLLDPRNQLRRFFSTGLRPAPFFRTRTRSTSLDRSCCRPFATVPGSRPRRSAVLRSPP